MAAPVQAFDDQTKTTTSLALPDPLPNRYAGKGSGDLPMLNPLGRNVMLPNNVVWQSTC